MRKIFTTFLIAILMTRVAYAANVKWTAKTELTAIVGADILLVVDDVGGTPTGKKITVLNFFDMIDTSTKLATILGDETGTGLAVFGTGPTLITPALGTPSALVGTNISGTAAGLIAGNATALATPRTIGGVSFDGTANIVPTTIAVTDTTDATSFVALWESATGDLLPQTDLGITYNATTGVLTVTGFAGPLTGNVTGNADTVTTNANLTGEVTSVGNAATIADSVTVTGWVLGASSVTTLTVTNNIKDEPKHWLIPIINPLAAHDEAGIIPIWTSTPADLTVTALNVTLSSAANDVTGDLKYADDRITLVNPVVINDFDTTSGVRVDTSITSGAIPAGKFVYMQYDVAPNTAITDMTTDVTWDFD